MKEGHDTLSDGIHESSDVLKAHKSNMRAKVDELSEEAILITPQSLEAFDTFMELVDRASGTPLLLEDGIIVTEKLAKNLGAKLGDTIYLQDSELQEYPVVIRGVTENYIGHSMYIPQTASEQPFSDH